MRNDVITLISRTYTKDEYGVQKPTEVSRQVYCDVTSVRAAEHFEGRAAGLNPELRFVLFAYDYQGEEIVEHNGERYSVYRTYRTKNDTVELYTERKGGTNG